MQVADVLDILCDRYIGILNSYENKKYDSEFSDDHLKWMCIQIKANATWPVDKKCRWIGYVQGVMAVKGYINTKSERDFSRPLFHKCYDNPPETIERKQ